MEPPSKMPLSVMEDTKVSLDEFQVHTKKTRLCGRKVVERQR